MWKSALLLVLGTNIGIEYVNTLFYDSFTGTPVNRTLMDYYKEVDLVYRCTNEFDPCDPDEPRRVNGTCNNLRHPSRGAISTPPRRVLPPVFFDEEKPRKSKSGGDLPLERKVRTDLLSTGKVSSMKYTQLLTHFLVFIFVDIGSVQDSGNYLYYTKHCCEPKLTYDPKKVCIQHKIPSDDPVHRFSKYRCQNQTKPMTFKNYGCRVNSTTPTRVMTATSFFDLSNIYDLRFKIFTRDEFFDKRSYVNGSLRYEVDETGKIWPPSAPEKRSICASNVKPRETRCHDDLSNGIFGSNLFTIWFYRNHNRLAAILAEMNPCWDDDKLFNVASDINIATLSQIMFYEMFPAIFGRKRMIKDKIISCSSGFRDPYDESIVPSISEESMLMFRWFHTMQESTLKLYDCKGNFARTFPIGNLTLRTGYLALDDNLQQLTQGSFRQACGNNDYIVHPDMADVGVGPLQEILDITMNDLAKTRLIGFPPYIKYREFCTKRKYETFDDLACDINAENLERLKDTYENVEDIDLLAGVWLEKHIAGGAVPDTLYCLIAEQLRLNVKFDRFWYERPNRPNAFTPEQLREIRKANLASFICLVGDGVTEIQPHAFYRIGPKNKLCKCEDLPKYDFNVWKDETCEKQ